MDKLLLYVTSINILHWAFNELGISKNFVCAAIANNGHLNVLKWARVQNPPCDWNDDVCRYATKYGHLNVLQYTRAQNPPCPEYDDDNDEDDSDQYHIQLPAISSSSSISISTSNLSIPSRSRDLESCFIQPLLLV